jgi:prepilin-type N-terminal cleavage/methylation domain-containing protein
MNLKAVIPISNKGFTLVELIVGMAITTLISGLALTFFVNASNMFRSDRNNIETNQNLSAILDLIGSDIKQAGEFITESNFPVIQISQAPGKPNVSKIIIRRALTDSLPLCADVALNATPTRIVVADSTPVVPPTPALPSTCIQTPGTSSLPNLPIGLRTWRDLRCKVDNPNSSPTNGDYCNGNSSEVLRGALANQNGGIRTFNYTSETQATGNNKYEVTITNMSADSTNNYTTRDSSVYLIDERIYELDANTGEIKLSVNGGQPNTLIRGIEKFRVSTKIYKDPTERTIDPTPISNCGTGETERQYMCIFNDGKVDNWKNIAGIRVQLEAKDLGGKTSDQLNEKEKAKLSSGAEFFPRNIMSR